MSIKERIKYTIMIFCMVTTGMIIMLFITSMVYTPTINFQPILLGQVLLIAFLISIVSLVFHSSRQMSNTEVIIRRIMHLSAIIAIVIGFSYLFSSGDGYDPGTLVITVLSISLIYWAIYFVMYQKDKKEAENLNREIQRFKHKKEK